MTKSTICLIFICVISFISRAQTPSSDTKIISFNHLEKAIKNDKLKKIIKIEKQKITDVLQQKKETYERFYNFPSEDEFWIFLSEYWLIKNVEKLKWNYQRVSYNLVIFIEKFFESQGIVDKKFKILLLNTPVVYFGVLPSTNKEYIFMLSNPFIKALDLSKQEIALIFLQEILRNNKGISLKYLKKKKIQNFFSSNFHKKKFPLSMIKQMRIKMDQLYIEKGYTFQDQFEVTKEMDVYLKSDLKVWNSYLNLLKKIDQLAKTNVLYRDYIKRYPSPEMQINWLVDPLTPKSTL